MRAVLSLLVLVVILVPAAVSTAQVTSYEVWVGNQTTDEVLVYDGRTLSLLATIPMDADGTPSNSAPHLITFTPDHRYALVANVVAGAKRI